MKLERYLRHIESQLIKALNENDEYAVLRLYCLLNMMRKERIDQLEREVSRTNQAHLKTKLAR